MLVLERNNQKINEFVRLSISRFEAENGKPLLVGIYCCPWAGWITTNFNLTKEIIDTNHYCPDFEYVEYDILELPEWVNEYETDFPEFALNGDLIKHDHDLGDENLNRLMFHFLKSIMVKLKSNYEAPFILQMVDSEMIEVL